MARRKRGFWAEMQHQAAQDKKKREARERAWKRAQDAKVREAERARAAAVRAKAAAERAEGKERAAAEREAKRLHVEAMQALAASRTEDAMAALTEFSQILEATLDHDDFVDLELLRQTPEHPTFSSPHAEPMTPPEPISAGEEPVFDPPAEPRGMKALFGSKSKHAEAVAKAKAEFEAAHAAWRAEVAALPQKQLAQMQQFQEAEMKRQQSLAQDRERYEAECAARNEEVATKNAELDYFISGLAAGRKDAVEQYFAIVLGNSTYPGDLDVGEEVTFDEEDRELHLKLFLPLPEELPQVKGYRYIKAQDEIVETARTAADLKRGYLAFIHQVTLRTLHEVWEADRDRVVETISLTAGTDNVNPATGRDVYTPMAAVAVDRDTFEHLNLRRVEPSESMKHLKAVVTKDPVNFVAIDTSKGVRR